MSLTPARRKSLQRQRDRAAGWVEINVKVAADRVGEVRAFVASLAPPEAPIDPRQLDLIERIEQELNGENATPEQNDLFG